MKVSVKIMARMNANAKNNQGELKAIAEIVGKVVDYYDKGKKYDYVTVYVPHDYDEYYDRFKIAVNKNWQCPDNGEIVSLTCNIKCYKGYITLKDINADNPNA